MDEKIKRSTNSNKKTVALITAMFVVSVWLVMGAGLLGVWIGRNLIEKPIQQDEKSDSSVVLSQSETDVANLAKKVSPSVVSIITSQSRGSGYFQQEFEGAGTGIIISKDGYVLTNKHVVRGARSATIVASDGQRYEDVDLVGSDPLNDIAFLKIKGVKDLPAADLGDSGSLQVGQKVVAIGNSLGQYQNTVTSGIVSGLGRPVVASADGTSLSVESLTDLIQTDAAINRGNSGGPLLNMAGQVVGINTAVASNAQSIGFAIPINAAKGLVRGVLSTGKIQKAYLGVRYVAITPDVRVEYDLSERQGALVQATDDEAVATGSPAEKAGLKDGDIITKVNQKRVGEQGGLGSLLAEFLPGEEVGLTLVRDKEVREVKLKLGDYQP